MTDQTIIDVISKWKLNKGDIASRAGISPYTIRRKLAGDAGYTLTDSDIASLTTVLKELAKDINDNL